MKKFLSLALILSLLLFVIGCDHEEDAPEAQAQASQVDHQAPDQPSDPPAAPDAPAPPSSAQAFQYPGLDLSALSSTQRSQLAGLAQSELCPCPDAVVSLHECMQEEQRCEAADEMANTFVTVLREGAAAQEALGRVAQERFATGRVHQFNLEGVPHKGNPDAAVVIVEFADFQCPHCRTAAQALDQVYAQFGDQIAIYFKNFPLGSPVSDQAARAVMAAHAQNRFWPMHDLIFENQQRLSNQQITAFAHQLGLNYDRFQQDMAATATAGRIARDQQEAMSAGVQGTPAVFINGQRYQGPLTSQALSTEIRSRL